MKLLLTTSRKTSVRVRQFLKELSYLFPKPFIQRTNRGKQSLEELFEYSKAKYDRILLITNRHGNPHKIIGYYKTKDEDFVWCFEFKLRYTKLSYEFDILPSSHPLKSKIHFINFDSELEKVLTFFFEPFVTSKETVDEIESMHVFFDHNENGFSLYPTDAHQNMLPPEILIDEIIIEDPEITRAY